MIAHEFSTCIGSDGRLTIPVSAKGIPAGSPVRVIVLTEEKNFPAKHKEMAADSLPFLDEVIREIKSSPQNTANPLKNSIVTEEDIVTPLDILWNATQ